MGAPSQARSVRECDRGPLVVRAEVSCTQGQVQEGGQGSDSPGGAGSEVKCGLLCSTVWGMGFVGRIGEPPIALLGLHVCPLLV